MALLVPLVITNNALVLGVVFRRRITHSSRVFRGKQILVSVLAKFILALSANLSKGCP